LNVSRERREHYQAELAKLEVDLKRGELVSAESVKNEAFSFAKTVREALINIPDRVANQFAAESDSQAIHMALAHEIQSALERLSNA
jgi:phage terminase Nu1 subunit (DNA packaging protein)